jgi:hypothetical protein
MALRDILLSYTNKDIIITLFIQTVKDDSDTCAVEFFTWFFTSNIVKYLSINKAASLDFTTMTIGYKVFQVIFAYFKQEMAFAKG